MNQHKIFHQRSSEQQITVEALINDTTRRCGIKISFSKPVATNNISAQKLQQQDQLLLQHEQKQQLQQQKSQLKQPQKQRPQLLEQKPHQHPENQRHRFQKQQLQKQQPRQEQNFADFSSFTVIHENFLVELENIFSSARLPHVPSLPVSPTTP
jgi:hypothetical protein